MDADRGGPQPTAIEGGLGSCWFCGKAVSPRALFCHGCGNVQPPMPLDPFTRLGLARRFDLDQAELARQYAGFQRVLAPERFASRGPREKAMAEKHRAVLKDAHDTLSDPLKRAMALLDLAGVPVPTSILAPPFGAEIAAADTPEACDALALRIRQEEAAAVRGLSAAFRTEDLEKAAEQAATLTRLQLAAEQVLARRSALAADLRPAT